MVYDCYKRVIQRLDGWITDGQWSKAHDVRFARLLPFCKPDILPVLFFYVACRMTGGEIDMNRLEQLLAELANVDFERYQEEHENLKWMASKTGRRVQVSGSVPQKPLAFSEARRHRIYFLLHRDIRRIVLFLLSFSGAGR